ncbi:MAG: EF-P lysine aminoacylase GenX [Gammaproteobacteria bacterium]|nr:EF-P lysine aminoacylase GenX [Gammaproteobacteria bacterium]MDE0271278.1 EF-P lysine aminoacylase GenX [Gammaproteobacteria bacterium]
MSLHDDWRPTCSVAALRARAKLLAQTRAFFAERDVIEVQTPTLGRTSVTEPQIESLRTQCGAFLQTSPEHYMKRLLAAGAPSIYQLGPVCRAGESGRLHQEEFTMLEWYRLGFDDQALMAEVSGLIDRLLGPASYERMTYESLVGTVHGEPAELDLAYAEAVGALGSVRCFVTDYPANQAALARVRGDGGQFRGDNGHFRGDNADDARAARFELIIDGVEIANGYHELTDAVELGARMARDNQQRLDARREPMAPDERLLAAMEAGLPECAGVAIGVDRLVMLALGASSLAEVVPFADR